MAVLVLYVSVYGPEPVRVGYIENPLVSRAGVQLYCTLSSFITYTLALPPLGTVTVCELPAHVTVTESSELVSFTIVKSVSKSPHPVNAKRTSAKRQILKAIFFIE